MQNAKFNLYTFLTRDNPKKSYKKVLFLCEMKNQINIRFIA